MTIQIKYIMKKELINSSNISKFVINARDRRDIRNGVVNDLVEILQAGEHFSSPFVINEINDKNRVIDGNHRLEAIKKCILADNKFEIVIWMAVYRELNLEEEREVFTLWNKGKTQSSTDFLKMHFQTLPLGAEMLRRLPVTIYGDNNNLQIKNLVGCQIDAKKHKKFTGSYSGGKEETVADFQALTPEDVDLVEEFVKFMKSAFGVFSKSNKQFYGTTPMSVFYQIWFNNKDVVKDSIMENAFKKIFANDAVRWLDWTKSGGRSASQTFYKIAVPALNSYRSTVTFRTDEEAIEIYEREVGIIALVKKSN